MIDHDSPFRTWTPAPEAEPEAFLPPEAELEWFEATAGTEIPAEAEHEYEQEYEEAYEQEQGNKNTNCSESGDGIIGRDDRKPVANTLDVPFRWICQIWVRRITSNNETKDTAATGVLVGPRHVLTVAHAIREDRHEQRGWVEYKATQIRVTLGRDGDDRPFDTQEVKLPAQIPSGWTPRGTRGFDYDYALLTLDTAVGDKTFKSLGGQKLCYWGSAACKQATAFVPDPVSLEGATGITAGYPGDRGRGVAPITVSGPLSGIRANRRFMDFRTDICTGQSGSPVWVVSGGEYRLVGIVARVLEDKALAVRVSDEFAKQLRSWMGNASDAFKSPPPPKSGQGTKEWELFEEEQEHDAGAQAEEAYADGEVERDAGFEADVEAFDTAFEEPNFDVPGEGLAVEEQVAPAPVKIDKLAFLTGVAAPLDPGIYNGPVAFNVDKKLQDCLKAAVTKLKLGSAPIALVDLSSNPTAPDFAGWFHKQPVFPASMAKLIPMFAAFQLRADLIAIQSALGGAPAAAVFAEARRRWLATQTPPAGAPVTAVAGPLGRQGDLATWNGKPVTLPPNSFLPNLEEIFDTAAGFPFKSTPLGLFRSSTCSGLCHEIDEYVQLEKVELHGNGGDRRRGFLQRQKLSIGFSNNSAATSCISDIGFPYIASLMFQTGLWDPVRDSVGGGLWLGAGYGGLSWRPNLLGGLSVSASPAALAALMTLIARGLAVDADSSAAMRALLNKSSYPGAYTRSGFQDGLDAELKRLGRPAATVFSKLGLLSGPEFDCAIIERVEGSKRLKYVAVAMNIANTALMHKLIVELDQCIRINNGL